MLTDLRLNRLLGIVCLSAALLPLGVGCAASRNDSSVVSQATQFDGTLKPAEMNNADLDSYLQRIGTRIVAAAKESDRQGFGPETHKKGANDWMFQNITFHLVSSKTLNAFTTGGNHVYIYNELFQLCRNEDELAAVMSHEYGHIYCRHVQKGQNRQYALMAAAIAGGGAGYVAGGSQHGAEYASAGAAFGAGVGQFANMGFTRGDEAQADETGFHFYYVAGWDPKHFGDFFQVMIDKGYDKTPAIESDHPTLASRVDAAKKRAGKLGERAESRVQPNVATPEQFNRFKELARQVAQSTPEDTKVLSAKQLLQALPRSCWVPFEPDDQKEAQAALLEKAKKAGDDRQAK